LVRHKKFGPSQNILGPAKGHCISNPYPRSADRINFPKAKLLQLKLLQIFARDIFLMKQLEIDKTKPTFILSV